jgi:hypothetical protein
MTAVSMTTFVDFVTASGTARLTRVRQAKAQYGCEYDPRADYYKPLRERLVQTLKDGWSAKALRQQLASVSDGKKQANYETCRRGFTAWAGRKQLSLGDARRGVWKSGGLAVAVNPELALEINGAPHIVKLYFKADPLSQQRANIVLELLREAVAADVTPAVLDVRRGKLFTPTVTVPGIDAFLASEAAAFSTLWDQLP